MKIWNRNVKVRYPFYLMLSLCSLSIASYTVAANDLSQIKQKIQQQQIKINEQRKQRSALQSTLKSQEIEMGRVIDQLRKTEMSLGDIRKAIKRTQQEIDKLASQEKVQKEKLIEQLNSAYRSGIHPSVLERLLSEKAEDAARMTAYYEHINQVRIEAIYELRRTRAELQARRDELRSQQKDQQTQFSEQKKQEVALKKVKDDRENTLHSIDKTLQQDESRLESLKQNEASLSTQITQATNEAAQQETKEIAVLEQKKNSEEKRQATEQEKQQVRAGNGLGSAQKQYRMPVSGKILNHFGAIQMGEIRWHGVVIQAAAGTPVRAIAAGKVILADWLQGYGQVVLIDHGKGDMSLYGYNQSVAVSKGSRVKAGDVVAQVGNSGGQSRSALYFEIRRRGEAQNPARWIK